MKTFNKIVASCKTGVILFCVLFIISAISCTKPGLGGKTTLVCSVAHHGMAIPVAMVYIKYGVKESPGSNVSSYDDHKTAANNSNIVKFSDLQIGDYYLYATGYDTSISESVSGGIPVNISKKSGEVDIDVPVAE